MMLLSAQVFISVPWSARNLGLPGNLLPNGLSMLRQCRAGCPA
jgi:hypothetical protein